MASALFDADVERVPRRVRCGRANARTKGRQSLCCAFAAVRENQLGYKMAKWIERIEFIRSEQEVGAVGGGKNEDDEYFDLPPNI